MALTFPLNLARFSDRLRVTSLSMHCPTPKSISQTGGGEILSARLGPSLWQGECTLSFAQQINTRGMRGLMDLLLDENASFLFSPKDYYGPVADLGGIVLGAATVTIQSVATNNRDVTLAGFPAGYVLTEDDLMSWTYATNPVRYGMHRVISQSATANASGQMTVEVWPRVRAGWTVGTSVELKKPRIKAVMVSREAGTSARIFHSGMSFEYTQSLR